MPEEPVTTPGRHGSAACQGGRCPESDENELGSGEQLDQEVALSQGSWGATRE